MKPLILLDIVGLTPAHIGADTPHLAALAGSMRLAPLRGVVPAVTTTAQATMLTGVLPDRHGIVGNGWHFRDLGEIWFWRQSQALVQAPHLWSGTGIKVLKHFWWYAMNTDAAATVTPRPVYHHDGRKSPDVYAWPYDLRTELVRKHGEFPLFSFWGPTAGIASTDWIADSLITAWDRVRPDLALGYLPHLDYDLQRHGPTGAHLAANLRAVDAAAGRIIAAAHERGARVAVVSEYGISAVDHACMPNRALREAGLLHAVRNAAGELLDIGASRAFAVCDHQIAHVSMRDPADVPRTAALLRTLPGVGRVLVGDERRSIHLDHPRSGDIVLLAEPGCWFAHDYWLDEAARPDFAACVEIHKKPGYDPRELLWDPHGGKARAGLALLKKKLGFRYLMDAITTDPSLVRGSHGIEPSAPEHGALIIADPAALPADPAMTDVPAVVHAMMGV